MDFMRLLQSVEELLYELVTWILFYPLTLARCIRRPLHMMSYAETELKDDAEGQYDDALSPPIFLLISLLLLQFLEPVILVGKNTELAGPLSDTRNLLVFQTVAFSVFPLLFALQSLRKRGARLTRKTLKPAFYSQCYMVVPFVIGINFGVMLIQLGSMIATTIGAVLMLAGLCWYMSVQTVWFAANVPMSRVKAAFTATFTLAQALLIMLVVLLGGGLAMMVTTGMDLTAAG